MMGERRVAQEALFSPRRLHFQPRKILPWDILALDESGPTARQLIGLP